MARSLSLGGILSRTEAPPDGNGELVDQTDDGVNGESRGGLRSTRPRRSRKGMLKPGERPRGCKLTVPDRV